MKRTNIFPVTKDPITSQMLTAEPIRIDGMKLVFDQKVALYPAKLHVEDKNAESESDAGR